MTDDELRERCLRMALDIEHSRYARTVESSASPSAESIIAIAEKFFQFTRSVEKSGSKPFEDGYTLLKDEDVPDGITIALPGSPSS